MKGFYGDGCVATSLSTAFDGGGLDRKDGIYKQTSTIVLLHIGGGVDRRDGIYNETSTFVYSQGGWDKNHVVHKGRGKPGSPVE